MSFNFNRIVDRRDTDSAKWGYFDPDVLPMWVADMDFKSPQPILDALHDRIEHGVFGYSFDLPELRETICARMDRLYDWQITPDDVVFLPGLVVGLNVVSRAVGRPGDSVLVNTPVYPPFLTAPGNQNRRLLYAEQEVVPRDGHLHYEMDVERLAAAAADDTNLFILCNPHNPTGRAFNREELTALAQMCLDKEMIICSDEIHCDLLLGDTKHIPIASLAPEVAARTITLMAPSKTYNIPGLACSMAIVTDPGLREQLNQAAAGIMAHVNVLGFYAALAAYAQCDDWLHELLAYLTENRDYVVDFVDRELPAIRTTVPEATYLAWFDCRESGIPGNPHEFFVEQAKVALNDGARFGAGGEGFVRLNFGCPRPTLEEGLRRIKNALDALNG